MGETCTVHPRRKKREVDEGPDVGPDVVMATSGDELSAQKRAYKVTFEIQKHSCAINLMNSPVGGSGCGGGSTCT